ncbi:MAG: hypothetical protein KatS3mg096_780 [Candidatus Parcubacteria bacterium]|nr:MAG: hypothetical protein KatS3mg096_780 [Candidatus Parcubacteria bacterium]
MGAPKGNKNAQKFNLEKFIEVSKDYIENPQKYQDVIPTVEGLAVALGVSREVIYDWAKKDEIVFHTLKFLNTVQSKKLITGGLLNKFNAAITKLLLSRHGYIEKTEVEEKISGSTFKMFNSALDDNEKEILISALEKNVKQSPDN